MAEAANPGEERAWDMLSGLPPEAVCRAAAVSYDAGSYRVRSFEMDFEVSVQERSITSRSPGSEVLLQRLGYFFRLSVLWYLVQAKDIACTGRPVKLEGIPGGEIFSKGSHILPLEPLARKYGRNKTGFMDKAKELGGSPDAGGDAAVRLHPLPRIPAVLALWLEDDEFPARADLFLDSTCALQLPTDIIWSVAMMTVLVMM